MHGLPATLPRMKETSGVVGSTLSREPPGSWGLSLTHLTFCNPVSLCASVSWPAVAVAENSLVRVCKWGASSHVTGGECASSCWWGWNALCISPIVSSFQTTCVWRPLSRCPLGNPLVRLWVVQMYLFHLKFRKWFESLLSAKIATVCWLFRSICAWVIFFYIVIYRLPNTNMTPNFSKYTTFSVMFMTMNCDLQHAFNTYQFSFASLFVYIPHPTDNLAR